MKKLVLFAVFTFASATFAQVEVHIATPVVRFEIPPPLVVVSPGIQVVVDFDEEVFFVDGWYWLRRDGHWFRTKDHHGGWVLVSSGVPGTLVKLPPGKYKRYKGKGEMKVKEGKGKHKHKHGKGKH